MAFNEDLLLGASSIDDFCDKAVRSEREFLFECHKYDLRMFSPLLLRRLFDLAGGMQHSLCNDFNKSL